MVKDTYISLSFTLGMSSFYFYFRLGHHWNHNLSHAVFHTSFCFFFFNNVFFSSSICWLSVSCLLISFFFFLVVHWDRLLILLSFYSLLLMSSYFINRLDYMFFFILIFIITCFIVLEHSVIFLWIVSTLISGFSFPIYFVCLFYTIFHYWVCGV